MNPPNIYDGTSPYEYYEQRIYNNHKKYSKNHYINTKNIIKYN